MRTVLIAIAMLVMIVLAYQLGSRRTTQNLQSVVETSPLPMMHIPEGDALAGQQAFMDLKCHTCHQVEGGNFPPPVAAPAVPIVLGIWQAGQPRMHLLESIVHPSHRIPEGVPDVQSGSLSRMGDYRSAMTVGQLLDLVEFLKSIGKEPTRTGQELAIAG